jgi:hypothetical protein
LGNARLSLFTAGSDGSEFFFEQSGGADTLKFYYYNNSASAYQGDCRTTAVFRDASAWYHIVLTVDTTQATASNRCKIYVNGVQQDTTFAYNFIQNADLDVNNTVAHNIGKYGSSSSFYFDGYLADIHFIDGQALAPSSFTEVSATTGQLVPIEYTGTYGTNGFWLQFADNSAATAAALGKDTSGNGNNWTPNNLSVTAGAGNDSLVDSPTSYGTDTGAGGEVRGNYATWSPLFGATPTLSNGNLEATVSVTTAYSSISVTSGKWYWEITPTGTVSTNTFIGIIDSTYIRPDGSWSTQARAYVSNGKKYDGAQSSYGASYAANNVVGVALDLDAGTLVFYKNGASQGTAFSAGLTGKEWKALAYTGQTATHIANFGQRPFAYTAPSGFKALCTANLTAPVIAKPNTVMDVLVFAATNANNTSITGLNFQPDLVWGKSRTNAYGHQLYDSVRGVNKSLKSNTTNAEGTDTNGITSFNSNGFTAGTDFNAILGSGSSVAWCWDAGTSTVTNTQGSITTSLRASPSNGFSVATWTGSGSGSATVGHGLGVAPQFFIVKDRSNARNWLVYHVGMGATRGMQLNLTTAQSGADAGYWNNTAPTSTVATIGTYGNESANYVGYFWAPQVGYTAMGSYTGDGSTSGFGPFIHCGFRPKFVLIKGSSVAHDWLMFDSVRNPYNLTTQVLYANSSTAEMTNNGTGSGGYESIDILSNGFQIKSNSSRYNQSSATYIYFAVAESPFAYARAR